MIQFLLTYGFAGIALLAAGLFVTFRQPVHAALGFAASVLAISGLYLLQQAPFVAAANVVVYAGATIIIFLFVLMFAQRSVMQEYDRAFSNPILAVVASLGLLGVFLYIFQDALAKDGLTTNANAIQAVVSRDDSQPPSDSAGEEVQDQDVVHSHSVAELGGVMYTRYLWPMELAGTLLLVATLGAIMIAQRETESHPGVAP